MKGAVRPASAPTGTRIEVTDLFAATPARLKFLKSDRSEAQAVAEIVKRLAIAHPHIRFTLAGEHLTPFTYGPEEETEHGFLRRLSRVLGLGIQRQRHDHRRRAGRRARQRVCRIAHIPSRHVEPHSFRRQRPSGTRQASARRGARRLCGCDGVGPSSHSGPDDRTRSTRRRCERASGEDRSALSRSRRSSVASWSAP